MYVDEPLAHNHKQFLQIFLFSKICNDIIITDITLISYC